MMKLFELKHLRNDLTASTIYTNQTIP